MTKKLEDLLNLPESKEIIKDAEMQETEQQSYILKNKKKQCETFLNLIRYQVH